LKEGVNMKKLLFIVNPKAGRTVIKGDLINILDVFQNAGYQVTMYLTSIQKEDNSRFIYENAADYDLLVCAGGDGTLDNTVCGIMKLEREIKRRIHMGYLPCGSTNDYAKSLKISLNPIEAAKDIVNGTICHVDVGRMENEFFIYVAAFGAFTDISYSTPQNLKNALGHAYIIEGLGALAKLRPYHMRAWFDGEIVDGDFIYGQITNSLSVGGFKNFVSRHMAFSDGLFETVLIRNPQNPLQLQRIVNSLLTENLDDELIVFRKTSKVAIKCKEEVPWTLDGEYGGSYKNARVYNIRKAVSIVLKDKSVLKN
jgi:lipid kinase, YegS/Rv2252/BmrU family